MRGEIAHPAALCAPLLLQVPCAAMLRGLFIADFVYSISIDQVQVHALDDLATPVAIVQLP